MKTVKVIPATIETQNGEIGTVKKRRVCAYARVSTDTEEQATSYATQCEYYTNYIKERQDWIFVKVYSDEGISGTNTKKRKGFNEMVEDALQGKIDLIVTKSLSRFARNTVDSLVTIRKLKEKGVECYFEKENIYTFNNSGELLLTILSSLAQEESRSISENVKWGIRQRFKKGKVILPYKLFLGYKKGEDGKIEIDEEQAKAVRYIYRQYLCGYSLKSIVNGLIEEGYKNAKGNYKWHSQTIKSILTNEKYKGEALLQKKYVVDFLTHEVRKNTGEIPQYYVENSHPAIIDPLEWEIVQIEARNRDKIKYQTNIKNAFNSKIICGECNTVFGKKIWHSTSPNKSEVYQCNGKFRNRCHSTHLKEKDIRDMFLKEYNDLIKNKEGIIENMQQLLEQVDNRQSLNLKIEKLESQVENLVNISNNLAAGKDDNYNNEYDVILGKYDSKVKELKKTKDKLQECENKLNKIRLFMELLKNGEYQRQWDAVHFNYFVEKIIVLNKTVKIKFRGL